MEYFRRLRDFWFPDWNALVWLLFALPALYFFQTTIHEGTHAMAALVNTGSFPKLAPFPHLTASGNFLNGVTLGDDKTTETVLVRTDCNSPDKDNVRVLAGFSAMPQFVAFFITAILSAIFIITTIRDPIVRFPLRLWFLGAAIDFMYGTARGLIGGCNESADWSKFMLRSDIAPAPFAVLTWVLWLGILSHFAWVYWSGWGRTPVAYKTTFWDYRWVALVLGILSLIAVIVSLAVSDPAIDKSSAAFIVPFVLQVGAMAWYWIYFGLTFRYRTAPAVAR